MAYSTKKIIVKVAMLKGEKGDTPDLRWGNIVGSLSDQTDLKDALALKADTANVDEALALKADTANVDEALALKLDIADAQSLTSTEIDDIIEEV